MVVCLIFCIFAAEYKDELSMNNLIFLFITVGICLIVFILLLLYQALRLRNRNRVMADTIGRLMHYRHIVMQNGDKEEIEEEKQDITKEEYQLFKDIDKRIMKERLFADPNFGRDELMRLFGTDKNTLPSIIHSSGVSPRHPVTCAQPVRPGFTACRSM